MLISDWSSDVCSSDLQWFNKRKSITALLREIMYNQPSQLLDSDADNKVVDADMALQVLGGDHVAFGYLTTTITVTDTDRGRVEDKVRSEEHTSELQSLMRISYAVFCLKKKRHYKQMKT